MNPHKNFILIFAISFAGFFLLPTLTVASGAAEADDSQVLATVDGESITMADLNLTLAAIGNPKGQSRTTLSPETVLRRLIQNRLLEQEGYRIQANERREVKTQVRELVEHKAMITLMDSVQASVKKPDPAPLLHAMETLGGTRGTTVMVGDSAADINAALAAGIPCVAVRYGYNYGPAVDTLGADAVVDSLAELL